MKLTDIGEFGLIDRISSGCIVNPKNVIKGIGDDCCIFKTAADSVMLLTTDMLVEDIHFFRHIIPPYKLGRKSIAVGISDIAAMGGTPTEAVISLALPDTVQVDYFDLIYNGIKSIASEFGINILGGDISSSPEHLVINVAMLGTAAPDEVLYRSGAHEGDVIFLTGYVGCSAAGLDIILSKRSYDRPEQLLEAHYNPHPHLKAGRIIARLKLASSLVDVSDGLAADLGHICAESILGAKIEETKIPVTDIFSDYCNKFGLNAEQLFLHVGEDYVLLGTVPEKSANTLRDALISAGCDFFPIGKMTVQKGISLLARDGSTRQIEPIGNDHFRR